MNQDNVCLPEQSDSRGMGTKCVDVATYGNQWLNSDAVCICDLANGVGEQCRRGNYQKLSMLFGGSEALVKQPGVGNQQAQGKENQSADQVKRLFPGIGKRVFGWIGRFRNRFMFGLLLTCHSVGDLVRCSGIGWGYRCVLTEPKGENEGFLSGVLPYT